MIGVVLAAIFFGTIAFIGTQVSRAVCAGVAPATDGPAPGRPPEIVLVAAAAILGGVLVWQGASAAQLGIAVLVIFALVACWCSDLLCGFLPDYFTLVPLAALLVFALTQRNWGLIASALVVFVPFALAAGFSRGIGMGWGDAKLVAITGAALGAPLALFALMVASGAALIGHRIAGWPKRPIAFAPYIAAVTGLALPLTILH